MMKMTRGVILRSTALASMLVMSPSQVFAQANEQQPEATSDEPPRTSIVVTARRREEDLQDVPLSVSALGSADLEARGIQAIDDIEYFVPNVVMGEFGRVNDTRMYIRGVGGGDANASSVQSGVGIYIDGIYMPRSVGGYFGTLDVERIEVLRGPQGTLFGKNTTGGAINYVSRKPGANFEGELTARIGNYNQKDVRLSLNVPIVEDRLFARFSGAYESRDGFYKELTTGDTYDDNQLRSARLALRWLPTDTLTIDVAGDIISQPEASKGGACVRVERNGLSFFENVLFQNTGIFYPDFCNAEWDDREFSSDVRGFSDTDLWGANLIATWDAPNTVAGLEDFQIKLTSGIRGQKQAFLQDSDFTLAPFEVRGRSGVEQEQRSVELQFNGLAVDRRLAVTAGVYYADDIAREGENDCQDEIASIDLENGGETECRDLNGFQFYVVSPFIATTFAQINADIITKAAYANLSFDVNEWLNLTGGARYTWEKRSFSRLDIANITFDNGVPVATLNSDNIALNESGEESWTAWTPTASIRVALPTSDFVDDANIYATWSQGFLSGGFNTEFPRALLGEAYIYDPERVNSYEIGLKSVLAGGAVRFNIAGFIAKYTDRQELIDILNNGQFPGLDPGLTLIDNAATATIKGIEVELDMNPTRELGITFTGGYLDARYGEFITFDTDTGDPIDASNRRLDNQTPRWQGSAIVNYEIDLPDGSSITPQVTGIYRGDVEFHNPVEFDDPPTPVFREAFVKVDARLAWENAERTVMVALWGKNVFDKDTISSGSTYQLGARSQVVYQLEAPRTYGLEATYRF